MELYQIEDCTPFSEVTNRASDDWMEFSDDTSEEVDVRLVVGKAEVEVCAVCKTVAVFSNGGGAAVWVEIEIGMVCVD